MYPQYNRPSTPNPTVKISKPLEISRSAGPKIQFDKKGRGTQPVKIEPKPSDTSFQSNRSNPAIMHPRSLTPNQPIVTPPLNISIANSGNVPMITPAAKPPPQTTIPQIDPKPAQPDAFNRLSLLSFVSTFEDEKSFNETDLEALGLDLKCQEPLLPMLHSVLSDAPLLDHSKHPMPECYSKIQSGNPSEKLSLFSSQTLLFIFYTYPRDKLQVQAAQELEKRQWSFDEDSDEWRDQDGNPWSVDKWREVDENQGNDPTFLPRSE